MSAEAHVLNRPKEGLREQNLITTLQTIQQPFLRTVENVCAEKIRSRGWMVCGPATLALSHILSDRTGIPIRNGGEGEHLELVVGVYRDFGDEKIDHTHLRYYTGTGDVYYIDPVSALLWRKRGDTLGAITIEKYKVDEIDQALKQRHSLYPASTVTERFQQRPPNTRGQLEEWTDAFNGPLADLDKLTDGEYARDTSLLIIQQFESAKPLQ